MVTEKLSIPNSEGLNYLDFLNAVKTEFFRGDTEYIVDIKDHPEEIRQALAKFIEIHKPSNDTAFTLPEHITTAIFGFNKLFYKKTLDLPKPPYFIMDHGGRYILGDPIASQLFITESNVHALRELGLLTDDFDVNLDVPLLRPYFSITQFDKILYNNKREKGYLASLCMVYFHRDLRKSDLGIKPVKNARTLLKMRQPLPDFYLPQEKQA